MLFLLQQLLVLSSGAVHKRHLQSRGSYPVRWTVYGQEALQMGTSEHFVGKQ